MEKNLYERPLETQSLLSYVNNMATLKCPAGLPPGSRVCFIVKDLEFSGKVIGLKKNKDHSFAVSVRLHGLSKSDRIFLEQLHQQLQKDFLPADLPADKD